MNIFLSPFLTFFSFCTTFICPYHSCRGGGRLFLSAFFTQFFSFLLCCALYVFTWEVWKYSAAFKAIKNRGGSLKARGRKKKPGSSPKLLVETWGYCVQGQERKNTADAMPAIIRFFDMQKAPDQNPGLGKKPFPFCLLCRILRNLHN